MADQVCQRCARLDTDRPGWVSVLLDYLKPMPSTVSDLRSHFGFSEEDMRDVLWAAWQMGWVHERSDGLWEAVDG